MHRDPTLQLVLATALDAVIVMRADGTIADWNHAAEVMFGWTRSEVLGQPLHKHAIPDRHRSAHVAGLAHYLKTGEGPVLQRRIEVPAIRKSGEEFPIELSISPVHRGDDVFFLGFARDISERRAAQAFLEYQAKEARLLHQVTTLAAETTDLDQVLTLCLTSICELSQFPIGHAFLAAPTGKLVSTVWVGDETLVAGIKAATEEIAFAPGVGLPGTVLARREALWVEDIESDPVFVRRLPAGPLSPRSAFAFPIGSREVLAVLEFFTPIKTALNSHLLITARTMAEQVARVVERQRQAKHQHLLLAELNHRAKNMLAVVAGLASQTSRHATSLQAFRSDFFERLNSLSRAYSMLTADNWQTTTLSALIDAVVRPHVSPGSKQLTVDGPAIKLDPKRALSISMILHELATNAVKYGALSTPSGHIHVHSSMVDTGKGRQVEVWWRETGVANVQPPERQGFGTKLIDRSAKLELMGTVAVTYAPDGVTYHFKVPEERND